MSARRLLRASLALCALACGASASLRGVQDPSPAPTPPAPVPAPPESTPEVKPTPAPIPSEPPAVVVARKEDPNAPSNAVGAAPVAKPANSPDSVTVANDGAASTTQDGAPTLVPERVTPNEAAAAPLAWDGGAPASPEALATLLASFENAYRGSFRYRSLGRSRGGRDVWLASVTRSRADELANVPSVLCAPRWDLPAGTAALGDALNQCAALLEALNRDAALAARLQNSAVHWLLDAQPERVFEASGVEAPTALDFPVGWSVSGAPRPHPLFDPESRAVASFALASPSIAAFARIGAAGDGAFAPLSQIDAAAGGSFERFVSEYLGARVYDLPGGTQVRSESRSASAQRLATLLAALPQLAVDAPRAERLRGDVWLFDIPLSNTGQLATLEGSAAARERASVWMQLSGATLAAAACSRANGAPFEPLPASAERVCLGHLPGGATSTLRVIVRGAEGSRALLAIRSLRAGTLDVALELK